MPPDGRLPTASGDRSSRTPISSPIAMPPRRPRTTSPHPPDLSSVADLLTALRTSFTDDDAVWYRGHGDATWQLVPSLARPPHTVDAERTLVKRFKQNAFRFLSSAPPDEWAWLFLMQHHGVPTRLLDWTESPLVGLWFAVANPDRDNVDGCLWALQPLKLNEIARFKPAFPKDIPFFGEDDELVSCLVDSLAVSSDGVEDLVGGLGPDVGAGVFVPGVDPLADVGVQRVDGAVRAAA